MKVLIADDARSRVNKFKPRLIGASIDHAHTPLSAIEHLTKSVENPYDYVFLDRDYELTLEGKPGNGEQITNWIVEHWAKWLHSTRFVIHSLNSDGGAVRMANDLHSVGAQYVIWRWAWEQVDKETLDIDFELRIGKGFDLTNEEKMKRPPKIVEGRDYYLDNGLFVFTEYFLSQQAGCCNNNCRHCPWKEKENGK